MDCPACATPLAKSGVPHCESPTCIWLACTKCAARISPDLETYYTIKDASVIWGNPAGYLKSAS